MKQINEFTLKELKQEFKHYQDIIYNYGCYSVGDVMTFNQICDELEKKGYNIQEDVKLIKVKV
jgi:alcohol dehydrogenase YqhD (iron-dependent ADH family)